MVADWSRRGEHVSAMHQLSPAEANEALSDPDAVVFEPDYNTKSGVSVRTVGYSLTA